MRFSRNAALSSFGLLASTQVASGLAVIESNSLNTCMDNSSFTASLFDFTLTPSNSSASVELTGFSSIASNIVAVVEVVAYGFTVVNQTLDPCKLDLPGFCPMSKGQIALPLSTIPIGADTLKQIPGIAYSVPDLDGLVRLKVYNVSDSGGFGAQIACLEANLSNTKSVYQKAVGWITAIIAGLGLITAGITSGLGNTNTAAHVAANAVSLFGVFQAQALIGMTAVTMPPIVQAWTQNFQWSMGIIRVGFLQRLATWYQRATGGTPTTYLSTLSTTSVQVEKKRLVRKSFEAVASAVKFFHLNKRADSSSEATLKNVIVRGIDRVGFAAHIEQTNIFMTGLIFFIGVLIAVVVLVGVIKLILDGLAKAGSIKQDKFRDFRSGWKIVVKGILFRLVLLGFAQMSVLCLWELVERDSVAEVVLALVVFISMAAALAWASFKVILIAKKSVAMHKNPAYILYSDPQCLNKWGFLYVCYKATAYYFIIVLLVYIVLKAIFIAFAQSAPVAQAVGLVIVEACFLILVSVIKPWMDKKTNIFNISIASINFLNAIFLLVFSNAFGQPPQVSGVMGVVFAIYNIVFIAVLLVLVLISSIYAIASKNPETRYAPMRDDRGSFIKSQSALTTELDALGATARGDDKNPYPSVTKEVDDTSSTDSFGKMSTQQGVYTPQHVPRSPLPGTPQMSQTPRTQSPYGAPVNRPMTAPQNQQQRAQSPYGQPPRSAHGSPARGMPPQQQQQQRGYPAQNFQRGPQRQPASPWQQGAGYD